MTDGDPLGAAGCEDLAAAAFSTDFGGGDLEVVVRRRVEGLTRFANSQVHQNVWRDDIAVTIRVVVEACRVGVATVHTADPAEVALAATQAAAMARLSPPDPQFPGLAPAAGVATITVDAATFAASPQDRADAVKSLLDSVPSGYEAAGAYRTCGSEMAVFTSAGQRVYTPHSVAGLTLVVMGASSSGWSEAGGRSMDEIDPPAAAGAAVAKAMAGQDPAALPAASYPVVLEPPAVASLMQFLAYLGFGGRDWLEGRSCVAGRLGERLTDTGLTLRDDALDPVSTGMPFDDEGTPKQRVDLLRDGVAVGVVHDRHTAALAGTASTGHALPAPNTWGPMATNPVLAPGPDGSVDDLVQRCERALLVTRFHYTNVVHPKETTITGMTRDGTFLIEDGRVTQAVRNLRFTQSIIAALEHVRGVSSETGYATEIFDEGGRFPALSLPAFTFSSTTSFG